MNNLLPRESLKKHLSSYHYAWKGLRHSFSHWSNLWIELAAALLVIFFAWYLAISIIEWAVLLLTISLVISLELVNTAVESVLDFLKKEHHEDIAIAKDVAAGAVFLAAAISFVVGLIIFVPKLIGLIRPIRPIG